MTSPHDRAVPETLKEALTENASLLHDVQCLALSLERLRRAAEVAINARGIEGHQLAVIGLLDALQKINPSDGLHLGWAADVIDEKIVRRRRTFRPQAETFEEVRSRAREFNLFVHYVHKFEGSEYAIYRGTTKIGDAANERLCIARLRTLMRTS